MQRGGAKAVRPRHVVSALVLVPRFTENVRGYAEADPACSIAYWGIALSLLWNPHIAPPTKNLAEGAAAIEKARTVGFKTEREKGYVDALAVMYTDYDKVDHRTRVVAYAKAMEAQMQRYPDD